MDQVTLLLAALRGLHLAAMLSLGGALVFAAWLAPVAVRPLHIRLARCSVAVAIGFGIVWFIIQAAVIAGVERPAEAFNSLPPALAQVATYTRFGQLLAVRLGLLLAVLLLLGVRRYGPWVALALTAAALALQGAIGHVGALGGDSGAGLVLSETMHLTAAAAWLGGLAPLLICLRHLPPSEAAELCQRFSPLGLAAVLVIAATGAVQGLELVGSLPALVGTSYGRLAALKVMLFLVALGFAARNRLSLTDRLAGASPALARRQLTGSIAAETAVGLAIVLTAGFLASQVPGAHEQPVWPFPWRPSLIVLDEPELRQEVLVALAAVAAGLALVAASLVRRRWRAAAALAALGLTWWWGPSLGLLFVAAWPTSFFVSPTGFSAAAIVHGRALFAADCAVCHGETGAGDGKAAASLAVHPSDLTAPHLAEHSDGELFWWIGHGMTDAEEGQAMPGFGAWLSEEDRWDLIDFIHANNAGAAMRASGSWPVPIAAPATPVQCDGGTAAQMTDLRGKIVLVVADPVSAAMRPPDQVVELHLGSGPLAHDCRVETSDARIAFALVAGVAPDRLAGTEFLVDADGWLRAISRSDDTPGWRAPDRLAAAIRTIREHPISTASGGGHEHHH